MKTTSNNKEINCKELRNLTEESKNQICTYYFELYSNFEIIAPKEIGDNLVKARQMTDKAMDALNKATYYEMTTRK